jgi:hypothetical protein
MCDYIASFLVNSSCFLVKIVDLVIILYCTFKLTYMDNLQVKLFIMKHLKTFLSLPTKTANFSFICRTINGQVNVVPMAGTVKITGIRKYISNSVSPIYNHTR